MRIIRNKPASGQVLQITCSGCGQRAAEAGGVVPDECVEKGWDHQGPVEVMVYDDDEMEPLCADCLVVMERAEPQSMWPLATAPSAKN